MAYIVIFILGIFIGALANASFRGKVVGLIRRLSEMAGKATSEVTRGETKPKNRKMKRREE